VTRVKKKKKKLKACLVGVFGGQNGWLLDGFPRTAEQVLLLYFQT